MYSINTNKKRACPGKLVRLSDCLNMTIAVDWDLNKKAKHCNIRSHHVKCTKFEPHMNQKVSVIRKYHNHTLQTNPGHREEEP